MVIQVKLEIPRINWAKDDLTLPDDIPVREILERLIAGLPEELQKRHDYVYDLLVRRDPKIVKLSPERSLQAQGVGNGDRLVMAIDLKVAGRNSDRLNNEYREILNRFGWHPCISFKVLRGTPPMEYEITYQVRGFISRPRNGTRPRIGTTHRIRINLSEQYPDVDPDVAMLTKTFHPNISSNGTVCVGQIGRNWDYHHWLWRDVILQAGRMLQFQVWQLDAAFDSEAAEYVRQHEPLGEFPLDDVALETAAHP